MKYDNQWRVTVENLWEGDKTTRSGSDLALELSFALRSSASRHICLCAELFEHLCGEIKPCSFSQEIKRAERSFRKAASAVVAAWEKYDAEKRDQEKTPDDSRRP